MTRRRTAPATAPAAALAARPAAALAAGALALAASMALPACGVDVPRATPLDVERAARTRPGTTLADLDRGRQTYLSKCTSCHSPVAPRSIEAARWPHHVDEMSERSHLSPEEREAIILYLTAVAPAPAPSN